MLAKFIKHVLVGFSFLIVSCLAGAAEGDGISDQKLQLCTGCHGLTGISSGELTPNLAGQKKGYLIKTLNDYRSGDRNNPLMGKIAKGLSDSDIEEFAAFFSSQKAVAD